jgi:hypothetical protein
MRNNRVIKPEGAQHEPHVSANHFAEFPILSLQQEAEFDGDKQFSCVISYRTVFYVAANLLLKVWCLLLTLPVNCKHAFLEGVRYRRYSVQIA